MPRLFTALEIPASIGDSLAFLRGGLPGARWISPENYHITLRFIGDIDDSLARDIFAPHVTKLRQVYGARRDHLSAQHRPRRNP